MHVRRCLLDFGCAIVAVNEFDVLLLGRNSILECNLYM